jgi:ubiquinone/menaquinone biosynthesis C-methylase UbiE
VDYDPTIYLGSAPYYARGRPPYSAELAIRLAEELQLDGTGRLLDVGCGPGIVTLELASLFDEVTGLDPDPDMLAEAAKRAAEHDVANATWVRARAEELPALDLGPLRTVTFGQSLHWTDRLTVVGHVHDRLEPGGAIVLIAPESEASTEPEGPGHPPIPHDEVRALVERYLGRERRAGQGRAMDPQERYEETLARSPFGPPRTVHAPGRPDIVRDVDGVVAGFHSMSWAAPHLFGDQLPAYEADLRALLYRQSPGGLFWDWPGDTALIMGIKRR